MSSLTHLRVTLWKNLHIRRYYLVLSILEFVIPIVIFYEGLSFRDLLQPITHENQTVHKEYTLYTPLQNHDITIMFTPNNTFTDDILKKANKSISKIC